jgi:hypothetical protein
MTCRTSHLFDLRVFLVATVALALVTTVTVAVSAGPPVNGFHFRERADDRSLTLFENDRPVLVYNFGEMSRPKVPAAGVRSSYVHPIYGLDSEVLTDDFPADHYHHHGLFWGWPHVAVDGREFDLWKMDGIEIKFVKWATKKANPLQAELGIENGWYVGEKKIVREQVLLLIHPATANGRNVDVALTWSSVDSPVTLRGAEGKSYGGLTLRFAPRKDTVITTPAGRATDDLLISRLPWADLSAQFQGAPGKSGAAVFASESHPNFPPEWMTRDYGVLAVGWPGVHPKTLAPEKPVTCRYRIWIHRGSPDVAMLQRQYDAYRQSAVGN